MLNTARSSLVGRPFSAFIFPEDQNIYCLHHQKLFKTGTPEILGLHLLPFGSQPFQVRLEGLLGMDPEGVQVCRVVISDNTRCRETEEEIHRNRIRYRELWEKTPVMMVSLTQQAQIDFVSDRFCEARGYRREEILRKRPSEFQTGESARYGESILFPKFLQTGLIVDARCNSSKKTDGWSSWKQAGQPLLEAPGS
jgi:PAS domain-containing protein